MQKFFRKLDIARHAQDKLLQVTCKSVLHHCVMLGMHINVAYDCDIKNSEARIDRHFLNLLPQTVEFSLNVRIGHPEILHWPSHQTIDIRHKNRQARTPNSLQHSIWEESRSEFHI